MSTSIKSILRDYRHYRHFVLAALVLLPGLALLAQNVSASVASLNQRSLKTSNSYPINAAPETTATPPAILVAHVTWQAIFQPNIRNVQPISLTLSMGSTEINYPTQDTDASAYFTVSVDGLPNGTYDYRAKGPKHLANAGTVTLTGAPSTQLEIGWMRGGDATNDNIVDTIDYSILKAVFGSSCGNPSFDARADFDNNCVVNSTDFGTLKGNYGMAGAPPDSPVAPSNGDAFVELQPGSTAGNCPAPPNGGTVQMGCRFVLDLMLNTGSITNTVAQQSYLTFTNSIIQNARVSSIASSCVPTNTFTGDVTVFDATLQNEVCNGPGTCTFRGVSVAPGSMAFAAGALANPPGSGTFRVAMMGLCAVAEGEAVLHWQFSPPATRNRHTDIVDANGNLVQDQALFTDYVINVAGSLPTNTPTPIPTITNTPVPADTNTPTNTRTVTPTSTPTPIPTDTDTPVPGSTNTPIPPGVVIGHLTWQGVEPANRPLVTGTLTLCVGGSAQSFGPFNADTTGNFTLTTNLPDGTYNWFIKGGRHISNSSPTDGAALVISGGQGTQEFGLQKSGNTNTDNVVNASDFGNLHVLFGMSGMRSADFDYNLLVNILDFGILKTNFGQIGHTLTCP